MGEVKTVMIRQSSRVSVKIKENFYTFEATEERIIEGDVDLEQARQDLWDTVHGEVDKQVTEVVQLSKSGR